jgi:hypothetical protein
VEGLEALEPQRDIGVLSLQPLLQRMDHRQDILYSCPMFRVPHSFLLAHIFIDNENEIQSLAIYDNENEISSCMSKSPPK